MFGLKFVDQPPGARALCSPATASVCLLQLEPRTFSGLALLHLTARRRSAGPCESSRQPGAAEAAWQWLALPDALPARPCLPTKSSGGLNCLPCRALLRAPYLSELSCLARPGCAHASQLPSSWSGTVADWSLEGLDALPAPATGVCCQWRLPFDRTHRGASEAGSAAQCAHSREKGVRERRAGTLHRLRAARWAAAI